MAAEILQNEGTEYMTVGQLKAWLANKADDSPLMVARFSELPSYESLSAVYNADAMAAWWPVEESDAIDFDETCVFFIV